MLDICAEKFEKMALKFNAAKCVAVIRGKCVAVIIDKCYTGVKNLLVYDQVLLWSEEL